MQKRKEPPLQRTPSKTKKSSAQQTTTINDYFTAPRSNGCSPAGSEDASATDGGSSEAVKCPMCNVLLSGASAAKVNRHVNRCMDGLPIESEDEAKNSSSSVATKTTTPSQPSPPQQDENLTAESGAGTLKTEQEPNEHNAESVMDEVIMKENLAFDIVIKDESMHVEETVQFPNCTGTELSETAPDCGPVPLPSQTDIKPDLHLLESIVKEEVAVSHNAGDDDFSEYWGDDVELTESDIWDMEQDMSDQTNGVNLEKRADDPQSVEGPPASHLPQYYPARIIPAWTPPESVPETTGTIYWTPNNGNRSCPWYKKMPDTPFTVDAFSFGRIDGCLAYFLTHFHADHYGGLTRQFNHGPVYCSVVTGNLVARQLGVSEDYIVRLPMETPVVVMGVKVTLIDANHCPGAVLFLFELPNGKRYLHTGDFRAHPSHLTHPYLRTLAIHTIYLDTTYCAPAHRFPPQDSVIQAVADMCRRVRNGETVQTIVSGSEKKGGGAHADTEGPAGFLKRWIVLVGAYTIGKEKIFHSIAKALGSTIFVEATKRRVLKQLDDPDLMNLLSDDAKSASVHVVKMGALKAADVLPYIMGLGLTPEIVICIRPTGWTFRPTGGKASTVTDAVEESDQATHDAAAAALEAATAMSNYSVKSLRPMYTNIAFDPPAGSAENGVSRRRALLPVITLGVPYSEHSSFNELESFVKGVGTSVGRVVPTVGQSEAIKGWCDKWLADRKAAAAAAAAALKR
ncbi:hypothetical protein PhCBS80983_g01784 [Powellomyces hirtus]|uniref:Metallo-beta-lactamase domain-containing protein n=1 Tax=Powellomyces hirtus TaxID=109895 RepID=A0A507EAU8_9FUNG|nr:hypothetical protein PhCBS80983_g01784 [Powellomyces hirtus]